MMNDYWDFFRNVGIIISLLDFSFYKVIDKVYKIVKKRVDVLQHIRIKPKRFDRIWYWMIVGFVSSYILYLIYSSFVVALASFTQIISASEEVETTIITAMAVLPFAGEAILIGYVYGRRIFKSK